MPLSVEEDSGAESPSARTQSSSPTGSDLRKRNLSRGSPERRASPDRSRGSSPYTISREGSGYVMTSAASTHSDTRRVLSRPGSQGSFSDGTPLNSEGKSLSGISRAIYRECHEFNTNNNRKSVADLRRASIEGRLMTEEMQAAPPRLSCDATFQAAARSFHAKSKQNRSGSQSGLEEKRPVSLSPTDPGGLGAGHAGGQASSQTARADARVRRRALSPPRALRAARRDRALAPVAPEPALAAAMAVAMAAPLPPPCVALSCRPRLPCRDAAVHRRDPRLALPVRAATSSTSAHPQAQQPLAQLTPPRARSH
eukprot:1363426-Rhodomonas_salina.1